MTPLPFHPYADIFPLLDGLERDEFAEDIRMNGLRDPIVVLDGSIIDGRNRYLALVGLVEGGETLGAGWGPHAGEPMSIEDLAPDAKWCRRYGEDDGDPLAFVISKNLKRRQLDDNQRAMVAAKLATMRRGSNQHSPSGGTSQANAAKVLNVSKRAVQRATVVQRLGAPELQRAVEQGRVAVSTAATVALLSPSEQAEVVARGEREVTSAAKQINARRRHERREQDGRRNAEISRKAGPLPTNHKYPVVYVDPTTNFGNRLSESHYPTESIDFWATRPVGHLALDDCVLFVWTTVAQLAATIEKLLPAWGFTYQSCLCWDKAVGGTGYWARDQHQLLLIATRGAPPLPEPADVPASIYREAKTEHSSKPSYYRELIERMTRNVPRIEVFARGVSEGWATSVDKSAAAFDHSSDAVLLANANAASSPPRSNAEVPEGAHPLDIPAFLRRRRP